MRKVYWITVYIALLGIPALILSRIVEINIKSLVITTIASLIVGYIVEIWAVRHGKKDRIFVWDYNSKSNLGIKIFDIPIEDSIVFLILTPIFIVYFYEFVKSIL